MLLKDEVEVEWIDWDSQDVAARVVQIFDYYEFKFTGYIDRKDFTFYSYFPTLNFKFADQMYHYDRPESLQSFIDGYILATYTGLKNEKTSCIKF